MPPPPPPSAVPSSRARRLLDVPRDGPWNMALDEVLLDGGDTCVRRARWREPCATIGRFQPYREFEIEGAVRPSVRRITGGGAILHSGECTISITAQTPSRIFPEPTPLALATRAAEFLRSALARVARPLDLRSGSWDERAQRAIDDCFRRHSPFDLVRIEGGRASKVVGLALHRRRGRVLVQSSIRRDPAGLPPELDLALVDTLSALLDEAACGQERAARSRPRPAAAAHGATATWSERELERARTLVETRYGEPSWSERVPATQGRPESSGGTQPSEDGSAPARSP